MPPIPSSSTTVNAVSELEVHRVVFNWDIAHFDRICPSDTTEFEAFTSGLFTAGNKIGKMSQWVVTVDCEDGYLQIWCHLENILSGNDSGVNEIRALISMSIMKPNNTEAWQRSCSKSHLFSPGTDDNGWGLSNIIRIQKLWDEKQEFLIDNTLRLQIILDLYGDMLYIRKNRLCGAKRKRGDDDDDHCFCPSDSVDTKSLFLLQEDLSELLKSQKDSDFTIQCGQKLFPVHKLIIASRSKVFSAMLMHNTIEVQTATVKIDDVNETIMEYLLKYIYTGTTDFPTDTDMLMSLIEAADKYQLNELKNRCFCKLCCLINETTIGKIAVLAYLHNAEQDVVGEIEFFFQSHWENLRSNPDFVEYLIATPAAFFNLPKADTSLKFENCTKKIESCGSSTHSTDSDSEIVD